MRKRYGSQGSSARQTEKGAARRNKDASAKVHDTSAQFFKQVADDAHDTERDAKALLDKAIEFYKEYSDTKSQTMMAAIHRA